MVTDRAGAAHPSQSNTDQRSEEHTSELQSQSNLVCRLLLEKKKKHIHRTSRQHYSPTKVTDSAQRTARSAACSAVQVVELPPLHPFSGTMETLPRHH